MDRLNIPPIRFYMIPNLVRRTFQSDNQCNFGETINRIFCKREVGGGELGCYGHDVIRTFCMGIFMVDGRIWYGTK